jgi:site-specific recombinase XerD
MLQQDADAFIRDCRSRSLSRHTVAYYRRQISFLQAYCETQGVCKTEDITADLLRQYLISLEEGHNPGGRHARYRAVKVFMLWFEREMEPENWNNPIHKVKPPKVSNEPIEGASIDQIKKMLATCDDGFIGLRDRAMLLFLLDSGVRVQELIDMNITNVLDDGSIVVEHGKGDKPRVTYIGYKTTKALRKYLRRREDEEPALWVTREGKRVARKTVQGMLVRRSKAAGIPPQSPHDFRRAFVLNMLRSGKVDVFSLKMLTGHTTLEVLGRYAAKVREDGQKAHEDGSPVDRLL